MSKTDIIFKMQFNIHTYTPQDKSGIKQCIAELKNYESQFDPDYCTNEESVNRLFKSILKEKEDSGEIFVAESNNNIVGFISIGIDDKNDEFIVNKIPTAYISDIVVLKEYRGKGIGKALMKRAEDFTKENRLKYVKLIVFSENQNAIGLYKSLDFEDYETTMIKEIK